MFQAHDLELDKRVAIKTLLPQSLADRRSIAQLKSEVRLAPDLRDENICGVYHFHISDSEPFIVMEFIDGEKLSDFIFRQPGHSCGEVTFRRVAAQILKAVEYAHGAGVIHRDLKTSNIMIRRDESVRVLDFGIAASLKDAHSRATGGEVALSIHYASPEQIRGERPSVAMDIYSLGCVFHEMLTGRPPFRQGDVLQRHLTKQPAPMPGVSRMLNRAVLACLAKDAKAQPQSAEDLAAWILEPEDLTVKTVRRGGNRAIWGPRDCWHWPALPLRSMSGLRARGLSSGRRNRLRGPFRRNRPSSRRRCLIQKLSKRPLWSRRLRNWRNAGGRSRRRRRSRSRCPP